MNQTLADDVKRCLDKLHSELPYERRQAAEELGDLKIRDERIHAALRSVAENDLNSVTRGAANQALNILGYPQVEGDTLDSGSQTEVSKHEELQKAAIWYRWLWLSPLLTIPTLSAVLSGSYTFFYTLICTGGWRNCDYETVTSLATSIGILFSALWHLVLFIPSLDKKSEFVRWHGRQALSLAGLRSIIPLILALVFGEMGAMVSILILIAIWLGGTLWGQGQAKRGDCSLMRWFGREEALPGPVPKQKSKRPGELDADSLVDVIRYSDNRKNRRLALAELKKRDMVEDF